MRVKIFFLGIVCVFSLWSSEDGSGHIDAASVLAHKEDRVPLVTGELDAACCFPFLGCAVRCFPQKIDCCCCGFTVCTKKITTSDSVIANQPKSSSCSRLIAAVNTCLNGKIEDSRVSE